MAVNGSLGNRMSFIDFPVIEILVTGQLISRPIFGTYLDVYKRQILICLELRVSRGIESYISFIEWGVIFTIINFFAGIMIGFFLSHKQVVGLIKRLKNIVRK